MNRTLLLLFASICLLPIGSQAEWPYYTSDPLAARDEDGLLHQSAFVERTDLAPRYTSRFEYYFISGKTLATDPAFVGALQDSLFRHGYYCGPIDGVFSAGCQRGGCAVAEELLPNGYRDGDRRGSQSAALAVKWGMSPALRNSLIDSSSRAACPRVKKPSLSRAI